MPYNGSGTFSLTYNWATEQASSPIEIAKLDTQESDIASGLSNCILRDGTGLPSTTIPWNSQALTGVSNLSAERVTVTGSTVPANGMYLSAANTVAWASNTTLRGSVNSTGQWSIAPPTSGTAFTINGLAGQIGLQVAGDYQGNWPIELTSTGGATTGRVAMSFVRQGGTSKQWAIGNNPDGASDNAFGIRDITRGVIPFSVSTTGNVTIAAPSSGTALAVTGESGAATIATFGRSGVSPSLALRADGTDGYFGTAGAHPLNLLTNGTSKLTITSAGNVTIAAPSSGTTLALTHGTGSAFTTTDATVSGYWGVTSTVLQVGTSSAHSAALVTNTQNRVVVTSTGNVTINAPSSGAALTVAAGSNWAAWTSAAAGNAYMSFANAATRGYIGTDGGAIIGSGTGTNFGIRAENDLFLMAGAANRVTVASTGNVTINAPSSGATLAIAGNTTSTSNVLSWTGNTTGGAYGRCTTTGADLIWGVENSAGTGLTGGSLGAYASVFGSVNATSTVLVTNSAPRLSINSAGNVTINAASSGTELTVTGEVVATSFSGDGSLLTALNATQLTSGTVPSARITSVDAAATINSFTIGYRQIPLSATTSGSLPTSDVGKMVAATAGITIPNSTFSAGDAVSIVNDSASAITITASITTLYWTQTGGTGTRTLAARGSCTVWFKSGTVAYISGAGLS